MNRNILYIYESKSSFIQKDLDFLSQKYKVTTADIRWNKLSILISFLRQFLFLLKNIRSAEIVFVMFGGYWSFLPTLLGKLFNTPVCIILGGTDCVSYPSINYGSLRKPILKWFIGKSYKYATMLLPVHKSLIEHTNQYYLENEKNQGVLSFFPRLKTPYKEIYNGFDFTYFGAVNDESLRKVEQSFISVALVDSERRFILKGFDKVYQLAALYPKATFTLVGMSIDLERQLELKRPENLKVFGALDQKDFKKELLKAQFYLQLSISEGFPNALCEGMMHGCIPIGSNVMSIPFIIEDTGFIVSKRNDESLKEIVDKALSLPKEELEIRSENSKKRILNNFSLKSRAAQFYDLIENVKK